MPQTVLVIDDDNNMRWVIRRALTQAGYNVAMAASGEEGLELLAQEPIDLVLLDLKMPGLDGLGVLRRFRQGPADVPVILLTAYASVQTAVEAMKLGATDYLSKPFDVEALKLAVERALRERALAQEVARLRAQVSALAARPEIVGKSAVMAELLGRLPAVAIAAGHVLVTGEPGTGKRLLARAIHLSSPRQRPLVEFDAAALPGDRAERELFGQTVTVGGVGTHLEGALDKAMGGTLLLAALDRLSPTGQERLAALLPKANLRLIATATGPLSAVLHQALAPLIVTVPPLRERRDDVPLLVKHFLGERALTPLALQALLRYDWPGNVAELRRLVERAAALAPAREKIDLEHLPEAVAASLTVPERVPFRLPPGGVHLEEVERELIRQALERAHGNKTRAAELLGLTRHTLLYRLEKYGLKTGEEERI
jgi:two-component system NtrC family response regulator